MNKFLFVLVCTVILICIALIFVIVQIAKIAGCSEGEIRNCTIGNCTGSTYCLDGKWSPCMIPIVCRPGSVVGCYVAGCGAGYKTCNVCGTGYSECYLN